MDIGSAPQGDKRYYRLPLVIVIIGLTTGFAVFVTLSVLQRNNVRDEFMRNARIQTERLDLAAASYNAVLHSANLIVTQSSDDRVATESLSQLPLITAIADYRVSADRLNVKKGLSYSRDQMSFLRRVAVASINKTQPAVRIYGESSALAVTALSNNKTGEISLFSVNLNALFGNVFMHDRLSGYIIDATDDAVFNQGADEADGAEAQSHGFTIGGEEWRAIFWPGKDVLWSRLPWVALVFGTAVTAIMGACALKVGKENRRVSMQAEEKALALELQNRHLEHLTKCLERGNEDMEQFTYVVSHDLKSPLRAIHTVSQMLEDSLGDKLSEEEREYMDVIRTRVSKMGELLDQVLNFARNDKYSEDGECGPVTLKAIVEDLCDLLHIPEGFTVDYADIPENIVVDKLPLQQVLHNLIDNAVRHHDKDSGLIKVSASETDDDYIKLCVADDGPGISEDMCDKALKMFRKLTDVGKTDGAGFGLAMTRRLILRYGGDLTLEKNGEKGLVCRFAWPRHIYDKHKSDLKAA